jgi:hypothetical protein
MPQSSPSWTSSIVALKRSGIVYVSVRCQFPITWPWSAQLTTLDSRVGHGPYCSTPCAYQDQHVRDEAPHDVVQHLQSMGEMRAVGVVLPIRTRAPRPFFIYSHDTDIPGPTSSSLRPSPHGRPAVYRTRSPGQEPYRLDWPASDLQLCQEVFTPERQV